MLNIGTIQNSCSLYTCSVSFDKNKNGIWRLYVDYIGLKGMVIKDRFSHSINLIFDGRIRPV